MNLNATYLFLGGALSLGAYLPATPMQMEKRETEQYLEREFAESKPAVNELAPDMVLRTLDGQSVSLSDYRGTNIVVVKAGYT